MPDIRDTRRTERLFIDRRGRNSISLPSGTQLVRFFYTIERVLPRKSIDRTRKSSEFIRRSYASDLKELTRDLPHEEAPEEKTHEEFVVLDRIGRMQIPKEFMEHNNLKPNSRLRFEYENGQLILSPMEVETAAEAAAKGAAKAEEAAQTAAEGAAEAAQGAAEAAEAEKPAEKAAGKLRGMFKKKK